MLPFDQTVEIRHNPSAADADPLAVVKGRVWPVLGAIETARGEKYNATGELEPAAAQYLVGHGNRKLTVEGVEYKVVAAVDHGFVPHVEVSLFELRPGG